MPESSLSLTYNDLAGEVGRFLGYGPGAYFGSQAWTADQQAAIDGCVRSGLRQFYFPPPQEGYDSSYDWSFTKPVTNIALPTGGTTVALPDDFGGIEGDITLLSATSQISWSVPLKNEEQVRQKYSELPNSTGRPVMAAVQPIRQTSGVQGQRFQLLVWPVADQAYTLQISYYVNADALTANCLYPLGGMAHAETILESCLAIAEERLDDSSGVHAAKFAQRLAASISMDRRLKPQTLGNNGDRSDRPDLWGRDHYWDQSVTYRGVQY